MTESSSSVSLTGLRADVPLGFMAAMGLWRILGSERDFRMSWVGRRGSFHPVLHGEGVSAEVVKAACLEHLEKWPEQVLFGSRDAIKDCLNEELPDWRDRFPNLEDWFAAFCVEARSPGEKVEKTPLDMSFARQKFLGDTLKLRTDLQKPRGKKAPTTAGLFEEALFGPWRYRDDCHSRGWDSSTLKEAAFTHQEPSPMPNAGVTAAVWLAVHSLPCFPCYSDRGRLRPRGFTYRDEALHFSWPVWSPSIPMDAALVLLGQVARIAGRQAGRPRQIDEAAELKARGVLAVFASERRKLTKYMVSLLAPERLM